MPIGFVVICLLLGLAIGFLSGLFGIGGGTLIIPVLLCIFPQIGIDSSIVMPMAIGTSFAIIIITSLSSSYQHYKLKNISFSVAKIFIPILFISVISVSLFVDKVNQDILKVVFSLLLFFISINMIFPIIKHKIKDISEFKLVKKIAGASIIGIISSFAGIAGGAFMVPFFKSNGLSMSASIGTSSFCGIFVALAGSMGFIISGLQNNINTPQNSLGYVYIPAVLIVSSITVITSAIGAKLTLKLPVKILKNSFAIFLLLIAIYMFMKNIVTIL